MLGAQSKAQVAQQFFSGVSRFGVVGASADRSKFGNKVLRWYQERKLDVTPINPKGGTIESLSAVENVTKFASSKGQDCAISVITPPAVTTGVIRDAHAAGIEHVWLQPGSESVEAVQYGQEHNMTILHDYCILVSGDEARSHASKF